MADKINEAVLTEARRMNPRPIADDCFAWLNSVVAIITKQSPEDIPQLLEKRLSSHYEFTVAFHGTRSNSAEDFLQHGIYLPDIRVLELEAIRRFGDSAALQSIITELRESGYAQRNHGKIHLSLTKEVFQTNGECDGYLNDGGEYFATIANRLRRRELPPKPLIVECLIPASNLTAEFWRARSYEMLEDYFTRLLNPLGRRRIRPSYLVVTQPIPAENILRVHEFAEAKRKFKGHNLLTGLQEESVETILRPLKIWLGNVKT
ncbi:MAG TPA: hypothetical protein VN836_00695 [Verrucomicrobiae bacterium]|nr:hypothetical protein [Verrucomicrobiae bacterium]